MLIFMASCQKTTSDPSEARKLLSEIYSFQLDLEGIVNERSKIAIDESGKSLLYAAELTPATFERLIKQFSKSEGPISIGVHAKKYPTESSDWWGSDFDNRFEYFLRYSKRFQSELKVMVSRNDKGNFVIFASGVWVD